VQVLQQWLLQGGGTALLWNVALRKCCSSGCSPLQSATDELAQAAAAAALPVGTVKSVDIRIPCYLSMFLSTEMKPTFCNELNLSP
jgi:hypothetical protein